MTPLDKSLKRALTVNGRDYVITLTPDMLKITEKGRRLGVELKWADLVSGESALAVALHASIGKFQDGPGAAGKSLEAARRPAPSKRIAGGARRDGGRRAVRKRPR
jgi:hypothetical protein